MDEPDLDAICPRHKKSYVDHVYREMLECTFHITSEKAGRIVYNVSKKMERQLWEWTDYDQYVEVMPLNDTKEHFAGDECWCNPRRIDEAPERPVISHNAEDGRKGMSSALERVAKELDAGIQKHGIKIHANQLHRYIEWRDVYVKINYGTTATECRRKLKKLIKAAEETERKETQETLL